MARVKRWARSRKLSKTESKQTDFLEIHFPYITACFLPPRPPRLLSQHGDRCAQCWAPCSAGVSWVLRGAVWMLQAAAVKPIIHALVGCGVATGAVLVAVPLTISSLGFTTAGITAGSIGAKMMSAAAIANGGGVAAGSIVAVLQSVGAAGLSIGVKLGLASVFGPLGALIGSKIP
ncbi:interferon alpha-inducible protein 27-like protein 2 [Tympanuchus pallidicinctus]|uniref:interferon alpha-inducible protein 27-like protein 2 n=1 Tax=Tympanuchus pallidicinctus TaxID=109042 RepID=UPI002286DC53|nr:interferon alpha-inducible protein 27-like protein 2 [Tympanuchus pallidicinctus]